MRNRESTRRAIWLLAVCLALAGCDESSSPPPVPLASSPVTSPAATLFFCTVSDPQCRTSVNSFEGDTIRDLFVLVAWQGLEGQHTVVVEFILPDGNLYQRLEVPFDTSTAPTSQGEPVLVVALPVAGTFITQHSLYGTWGVGVFLGGSAVSSANFVLLPPSAP
ncbi:MAG: hypothetical protein ACE5IP_02210 [Terriglobia bacterium]